MCTKHVSMDDVDSDGGLFEASSQQVRNAEAARKRGKLTPEQHNDYAAKWQELSDADLDDLIERFETQLRHHVYKAADCPDDSRQEPYERLQRSRDQLHLARTVREYRHTDRKRPFAQYKSIIRLQCLCRWYLARMEYQQRLTVCRESTEIMFETDEKNEAALVIQGMLRRRMARKKVALLRGRLCGGAVAVVKATGKAPRPPSAGFGPRRPSSPNAAIMEEQGEPQSPSAHRLLPMDPNADSPLPPGYHVTDVTGVPLSDSDLRSVFQRLREFSHREAGEADTDRISKLAFRNYYHMQEHYGLEMSDAELNNVMAQYASQGADWLSFDEFAVLTLRLSQR